MSLRKGIGFCQQSEISKDIFLFFRSFDYVHQRTIKKIINSVDVRISFNRINGIS